MDAFEKHPSLFVIATHCGTIKNSMILGGSALRLQRFHKKR